MPGKPLRPSGAKRKNSDGSEPTPNGARTSSRSSPLPALTATQPRPPCAAARRGSQSGHCTKHDAHSQAFCGPRSSFSMSTPSTQAERLRILRWTGTPGRSWTTPYRTRPQRPSHAMRGNNSKRRNESYAGLDVSCGWPQPHVRTPSAHKRVPHAAQHPTHHAPLTDGDAAGSPTPSASVPP